VHQRAIAAGLRRGTVKTPGATIEGFQCDGRWALAIDVYQGVTVPDLLRAKGARWVSVNRVEPCKKHAVPKKIYFNACSAAHAAVAGSRRFFQAPRSSGHRPVVGRPTATSRPRERPGPTAPATAGMMHLFSVPNFMTFAPVCAANARDEGL
jgi:hypothetical protein